MANTATVVPVRVLGCNGSGTNAGVIAGVDHVRTNCGSTVRCVANMSLGGGASATLDTAVRNAVNAGIPFAVAAGNSNVDASTSSPAREPAAITVGCLSDSGYPASDGSQSIVRCSFSNFGPVVDIWASGLTVLGADDISDTATQTISGTSMSAPHVAGAIAQLLSCSSTEPTPAQVEAMLDDKAISNAISNSPSLGGAQNLVLCSDFNDDGVDDCACTDSCRRRRPTAASRTTRAAARPRPAASATAPVSSSATAAPTGPADRERARRIRTGPAPRAALLVRSRRSAPEHPPRARRRRAGAAHARRAPPWGPPRARARLRLRPGAGARPPPVVLRSRLIEHGRVIDADDAGAPETSPDGLPGGLRGARPPHDDVSAALVRARVAAKLFGAAEAVRIGRYEIEARAGAGGGGEVFVARDPELSRRVAIKLMRAGGYRDRMLAEGQALARLSHPNIVPVYDAGTLDDQVYLVMELVEGDTLRTYCEAGRSVREIVRAYRQAAEGLAAAHRAGFIHRDFKPDNALVGRDGRVRVVDFGLARRAASEVAGDAAGAASPVSVTHAGLGTPRYMAPEQATGAELTPAADQYAFCASLREGLLACAPAVPRWLEAVLRRGLAPDPTGRYPSMAAVHAALGRDPASRWRARGLAAGVLGLAAAAFVAGRTERAAAPSCDAAAELAGTWSAAAAAQITARLAALATPYARQAGPHVIAALDGYANRWRAGERDACTAHRAGTQSTALFDRRVACLARARAALGAAVSVVGSASADQLADAIGAVGELPDLDRCADPSALTAAIAPPSAAVAAVSGELAALAVEVRAARPDVRPRIAAAVGKARALGYPPLVARALRLAGVAALAVDARADAVPPLAEATTLALTAGDLALAVECFARRMYAAGTSTLEDASAGADLVAALAAGLPASERATRVVFDNAVGTVALAAGRRDEARAAFERALRTAREVTGPARLEAAGVWTNLALVIDDPARRAALARERIAIVEAGLGAGHPLVLAARITAAHLETDRRRAREALEAPCTQLAELHPDHGFEILQCQYYLGWLAFERGDAEQARVAFTRAVASERAGGRGDKLALARAYLDLLAGRLAEAAQQLDAVPAARGPLDHADWWILLGAADAMLARGALARRAGRTLDARAAFEAARQALDTVLRTSNVPRNARRLAYAQTSLVRTWPAGALPPEPRRHAAAAIAWYRTAGGYDDVVAELAAALAR